MSGGSFNYLYIKDASDVFASDDLREMAEELEGLGHLAKGPAERTRKLLDLKEHIQAEIDALSDVWHAVEWWRSCDYGKDQVFVELGVYRERQKQAAEKGKELNDG